MLAVAVLSLALAGCSGAGGEDSTTTVTAPPAPTTTGGDSPATTTPPTTAAEPRPGSSSSTSSSSTTTTTTTTTTTRPPATTAPERTTTTRPPRSAPPRVSITSPGALTAFEATYDDARGSFGALVPFSASATDPDGDPVTISWSSAGRSLGTGQSITAWLPTARDTSQPLVTATATDPSGASSSASIQVIVWIVSDN